MRWDYPLLDIKPVFPGLGEFYCYYYYYYYYYDDDDNHHRCIVGILNDIMVSVQQFLCIANQQYEPD